MKKHPIPCAILGMSLLLLIKPMTVEAQESLKDALSITNAHYMRLGLSGEFRQPYVFVLLEYHLSPVKNKNYHIGLKLNANGKDKDKSVGQHNDISVVDLLLTQHFYFPIADRTLSYFNFNIGMRKMEQLVTKTYWTTIVFFPVKTTEEIYRNEQTSPCVNLGYGLFFPKRYNIGVSPAINLYITKPFEEYNEDTRSAIFINLSVALQVGFK
jgi:hypothetical protein